MQGDRAMPKQLWWKIGKLILPLVAAGGVAGGAFLGITSELRHQNAAETYVKYFDARMTAHLWQIRNPDGIIPDALSKDLYVSQALLLLYGGNKVKSAVATLERKQFGCEDEAAFMPFYDVLKAMARHVGETSELQFDIAYGVFCPNPTSKVRQRPHA